MGRNQGNSTKNPQPNNSLEQSVLVVCESSLANPAKRWQNMKSSLCDPIFRKQILFAFGSPLELKMVRY